MRITSVRQQHCAATSPTFDFYEDNPMIRTGGCLCGDVVYRTDGDPVIVAHCHCRDCQRVSGAGHTTGAMFDAGHITVTGNLAEYTNPSEAGNTVSHLFCARCSSKLFGKNTGMPGFMTIAAGTFDEPDWLEPEVTVFARSRCHWDFMDPAVTTYDAQPAWKPAS
jgi:hypothetical protein